MVTRYIYIYIFLVKISYLPTLSLCLSCSKSVSMTNEYLSLLKLSLLSNGELNSCFSLYITLSKMTISPFFTSIDGLRFVTSNSVVVCHL